MIEDVILSKLYVVKSIQTNSQELKIVRGDDSGFILEIFTLNNKNGWRCPPVERNVISDEKER